MTTQHTATPWAVYGPAHLIVSATVGSPVVAEPIRESAQENAVNAAHIVRCVNAHDELVAALRELSNAVIEYGRTDMDDAAEAEWDQVLAADKAARAALAKVEGQS